MHQTKSIFADPAAYTLLNSRNGCILSPSCCYIDAPSAAAGFRFPWLYGLVQNAPRPCCRWISIALGRQNQGILELMSTTWRCSNYVVDAPAMTSVGRLFRYADRVQQQPILNFSRYVKGTFSRLRVRPSNRYAIAPHVCRYAISTAHEGPVFFLQRQHLERFVNSPIWAFRSRMATELIT